MGHKIITEKDFWICSGGAAPAQLQSTQKTTKRIDGNKYITVMDTATSSWIDFGCYKLMLIMAILAAVIAVVIVATGGAALGAIVAAGAIAGAAGAAYGAIAGALICGQKAAAARRWLGSKSTMKIQGQNAISGDKEMICQLFGSKISYAPHIKNWWQAIALASSNYIGKIMEGMMAGAAIGMLGAAFTGGAGAFASGGIRGVGQASLNFLKSMPRNFGVNILESFSKFGLALRGVMGTQNTLATYGNTGTANVQDFGKGVVAMETGAWDSMKNVCTGQGTWQDFVGIAMMFAPVGQAKRDFENSMSRNADEASNPSNRDADAENSRADEESARRMNNQEGDAPRNEGDFEAFEADVQMERPSWRQSEIDVGEMYPDYSDQVSYLDGEPVPYGTEGSTRPDYFNTETSHSVEVKNYDVESSSGRSRLRRELERQYNDRLEHLPGNAEQTAVVDIRGQNVSPEILVDLETSIIERCPDMEVIFLSN